MFHFWKTGARRQQEHDQVWNECLDAIERVLSKHTWAEEDGDIYCDGCGARLPDELKSLRR